MPQRFGMLPGEHRRRSDENRLPAGEHRVSLTKTAADSGNVNVDSIAILAPGQAYPGTADRALDDCRFGTTCEAENGAVTANGARTPWLTRCKDETD